MGIDRTKPPGKLQELLRIAQKNSEGLLGGQDALWAQLLLRELAEEAQGHASTLSESHSIPHEYPVQLLQLPEADREYKPAEPFGMVRGEPTHLAFEVRRDADTIVTANYIHTFQHPLKPSHLGRKVRNFGPVRIPPLENLGDTELPPGVTLLSSNPVFSSYQIEFISRSGQAGISFLIRSSHPTDRSKVPGIIRANFIFTE